MYYLDASGNGSIQTAGTFDQPNRMATATTAMYRPGRILQVGGGGRDANGLPPSSEAASIININSGSPSVTAAASMRRRRHWADATVLADGQVLVNGGSVENNRLQGVQRTPELWNPDSDTWTDMAPEAEARLYHSISILLPDATVLVAGGGAPGPVLAQNAQIFTPPYLLDSAGTPVIRPTVSAPATIAHGQTFSVTVSTNVTRLSFIRAGSVTHSWNSGQRYMELDMTGSGITRQVTAPANANLAPPGTYLLFALDGAGTPSHAELVEINP